MTSPGGWRGSIGYGGAVHNVVRGSIRFDRGCGVEDAM